MMGLWTIGYNGAGQFALGYSSIDQAIAKVGAETPNFDRRVCTFCFSLTAHKFTALVHQPSSGQSGTQILISWLMLAHVIIDGVLAPQMQRQR